MIHNKPSGYDNTSSAHWAVGRGEERVLVQVNDGEEEARIHLTTGEARDMAKMLCAQADALDRGLKWPEVRDACPLVGSHRDEGEGA